MGDWVQCRLGDLFAVKHGYAFKGEFFGAEGNYVLLTPGNFRADGGLQLKGDKEKFYSGEFPDEYLLRRGDLLVAMTDLTQEAPILGSPAFIPEDERFLHNQRLGKAVDIRLDRAIPEFLFYLFNTTWVRGQIKGSASGATVRHTSPSRIYDVRVAIPPIRIQRQIAGILSAYDELIENNQRRIRILEEMARRLYREWFVQFRVPGRTPIHLVDSSLGPIPRGWEVRRLLEVASVTYGFPFASSSFNSSGVGMPVVRIRDIPTGKTETWTEEEADQKYAIRDGDILVGMDGDFHMCVWSSGVAFQNQRVAKFTSRGDFGNHHLYLALEAPSVSQV